MVGGAQAVERQVVSRGSARPSTDVEWTSTGLVHDYLLVRRGAERTFAAIAAAFPETPIYTLLHDPDTTGRELDGHPIQTSFLQRLGVGQRGFRALLPLYPHAVESLPVQEHDLVISSSSAFAHGVRPRDRAVHICYCHTPFRYAWHERRRALSELHPALRPAAAAMLDRTRRWDLSASKRVTAYIANSRTTQCRIRQLYGREAVVVNPPVDVERFAPGRPEDFLLFVGELVPHKRAELACEAATRARMPIKVVGDGPQLRRLRARFAGRAEFLGRIGDAELRALYGRALALIVPSIEEFGIAAVEAQAAGRPVVAVAAGGCLETVVDGVTGVLVPQPDVEAFSKALRTTDFRCFDSRTIRCHAERFSAAAFAGRLRAVVGQVVEAAAAR